MPEVICQFIRNTGQPDIDPDDIGKISRCIFESLALNFKYYMDILVHLTKRKVDLVHVSGGGAKNDLLCEIAANVLEIPIVTGPIETTSIGNLLMQLKAMGEISSLNQGREIILNSVKTKYYEPENNDNWREAYSKYLKLH